MPLQMFSQTTHVESQPTAADRADLLQRIKTLAETYEENLKNRNVDIGFNLFELISDHYYRETFHSDILNALLDPTGKHKGGNKYLDRFLEFINSRGANIHLSDYLNAKVVKEEGKIDILIKGFRNAIIIENKINDAPDQPEQLPRYLKKVVEKGYVCDAIIYLRLNGDTGPDMTDWQSDDDRKEVSARLKVICAYDDSENNLLKGWIEPCEEESKQLNNPDAQHILRQYGDIIKRLGRKVMNKPIMEKFYKIMAEGKNLKTALSLKAMMDELVLYRTERIIDEFKRDITPFQTIAIAGNNDAYFAGLIWNDAHLGLDIGVEPESYLFQFWDKYDPEGAKGQAKAMLKNMGCLGEYTPNGGKYCKKFEFPSQEEELIGHITDFKKKLGEAIESVSSPVR